MTREEAINVLVNEKECVLRETCERLECASCELVMPVGNILSAYDIAIDVLREQEERENPRPLTLAELREMVQRCEGVYVAHVDGSPVFRGKRYCAAVLDFSPAFGSNTLHVHAIYGDRLTLWEDDYGKTWLAYRSKPKEAMKNE